VWLREENHIIFNLSLTSISLPGGNTGEEIDARKA
jgi:hypothetical protein